MTWKNKVEEAMRHRVRSGSLAGVVTAVWKRGGPVEVACAGWRDVEAEVPMSRDTRFRIASMTKPITSMAALLMLEEGRFALEDAITRWAPELADLRVLRSPDGPLEDTVPAERAITFHDLLTHRAGLTYGPFHQGPIARAYEALGGDIDSHLTPDAWIAALGKLPLIDQPGG